MHRGYIKIWRKMMDNFLFSNSKAFHLWVHILMECNHKQKEFLFNGKKHICDRGEFITGRKKIAQKTGINENTVQRYLNIMENEHLIEQQKYNKFRLIRVINYGIYQDDKHQIEQPVNNKRTTSEQQVNTTKHYKNEKNEKKGEGPPTLSQIKKYCKENNKNVNPQSFFSHYESIGWMVGKCKMKKWEAKVDHWETKEPKKKIPQGYDRPKILDEKPRTKKAIAKASDVAKKYLKKLRKK